MPQMSPLMWLMLLVLVLLVYGLFIIVNYYIFSSAKSVKFVSGLIVFNKKAWRW